MLDIYIASSFRNLHLVHALLQHFESDNLIDFYDWTNKATPPQGLNSIEKRKWFDTDQGGETFSFCKDSVTNADLVIYLGDSGKDACIEIGMAYASDIPIIGLAGSLEDAGLMLNGAVDLWKTSYDSLIVAIEKINLCCKNYSFNDEGRDCESECSLYKICSLMYGKGR